MVRDKTLERCAIGGVDGNGSILGDGVVNGFKCISYLVAIEIKSADIQQVTYNNRTYANDLTTRYIEGDGSSRCDKVASHGKDVPQLYRLPSLKVDGYF
ncbi:hypothetical protein WL80_02655 [Burkholderia ubonensis]|nr:hypothetical protein WJ49_23395 [Burkholderia ubonensis]KVL73307.1 hypothetical protein WJ48_01090 [Burkholderia ubonensis]KVL91134.1 hypothetical protein WJ50_13525 [Burkholderia ubonensis]KWF00512.1 hypothetical protein WL80_02655 [Burkholderia ubonensis]OJB18810.1 hypothetical protein BGV54_20270 [Burkholderia ubonensis]